MIGSVATVGKTNILEENSTMKTKKLTPRNSAPVQRENAATVSRDGNAIAPAEWGAMEYGGQWLFHPFAGDDAE